MWLITIIEENLHYILKSIDIGWVVRHREKAGGEESHSQRGRGAKLILVKSKIGKCNNFDFLHYKEKLHLVNLWNYSKLPRVQ